MMFSKRKEVEKKEFEDHAQCFMILKKYDLQEFFSDQVFAKHQFLESPFKHPFGNFLFSTDRESYFDFCEKIDVNLKNDTLPPTHINLDEVTSRVTAEFSMSLATLKSLLDSVHSEWHGKKYENHNQRQLVEMKLNSALVATHIDIKNNKTGEWERSDSIKPKVYGCKII